MTPEISAEQLDHDIQRMLDQSDGVSGQFDSLLTIAHGLRCLPSQQFREQLRCDLAEQAERMETLPSLARFEPFLKGPEAQPMLAQRQFSVLPADPRSLFLSFLSHVAAVVLIASGIWAGRNAVVKPAAMERGVTYLPAPLGDAASHGGGGGDHSRVDASRGTPPKFANLQLAPPAIVVRRDVPKLQVLPTVLGPPQIKLPQSDRIGDLISHNIEIPSNGTGSHAGMGSASGTGIGDGKDGGIGRGSHDGLGGETFRPGNRVSAPRAIYDPDPEYSDEARKAKYQGTVVLSLIVDPSGHVRDVRIARSLGMGLDEKAMAAVQKWQFAPGVKDGQAVAVRVNVEVNFRLY